LKCQKCGGKVFIASCTGDINIIIDGDGNIIYTPKQTPSNIINAKPEFCRECGSSIQGGSYINVKS